MGHPIIYLLLCRAGVVVEEIEKLAPILETLPAMMVLLILLACNSLRTLEPAIDFVITVAALIILSLIHI